MAVSFSQNQKLFAATLAKATGLDPRTVESWMIAEEPAGANSGYQGTQDWLNVGITDSGPKGSGNKAWSDPVSAATSTANWMKGTWNDPGFGTASSGIQGILKTVGKTPQEQLAAIANSGWASSGYGGAAHLQSLLNTVNGTNIGASGGAVTPSASPATSQIPSVSASFPTSDQSPGPNVFSVLAGLEAGRQRLNSGRQNNSPDDTQNAWNSLSQLLSGQQAQQQGQVNQLLNSASTQGVNTLAPQPQSGGHSGDINPLQHFTVGRTDMGVDASAKAGTPILAPNDSRVVSIYPNWYQGQPYMLLQLTSGPNKGKYYYVAEQITNTAKPGSIIRRGQAVATYAPTGTGIEIGWGTPGWKTLAQQTGQEGTGDHSNAPAGVSFRNYLRSLGA